MVPPNCPRNLGPAQPEPRLLPPESHPAGRRGDSVLDRIIHEASPPHPALSLSEGEGFTSDPTHPIGGGGGIHFGSHSPHRRRGRDSTRIPLPHRGRGQGEGEHPLNSPDQDHPQDVGVWRARKSVTRRIDSARCVGPRQSFWTSRLGARLAISALVAAGCGLSVPGCSKRGVGQRRTKSRLTEKTKSPPNMLWPNFWMP